MRIDSRMKIAIKDITISRRIRKHAGDISALSKSMDRLGQLHPIVIDQKRCLVAGLRRLKAAQELGWTFIEAICIPVRSEKERFLLEIEENETRLDFNAAAKQAIQKQLRLYQSKSIWIRLYLWLKSCFARWKLP